MTTQVLREAYTALKAQNPHMYLRDAAVQLGVSEMALLPIAYGEDAVPLRPAFRELFAGLAACGPLMALSRNEWAVIETTGPYPTPTFEGPIGVLNSPIIDLRLYLMHWGHAYAVRSFGKDGRPLYSLQFFTPQGEAIHKVYLQDAAYLPQWEALIAAHKAEQAPAPVPPAQTNGHSPEPLPVDTEAFLKAWAQLQDTHDFFQLLRRFGLSRQQALQLAEGRYTWKLPTNAVENLLTWARDTQTPIMFFVGNAGMHHIFTGTIHTLSPARGWLNILDEVFTLHLNPAGIGSVYLVEKPTREGPIYSVEIFGPQGEEVLWIFGARKPGLPVPKAWLEYIKILQASA
ncbi:MAG: hemin-degrading factor [Bacteroidia bacterium]|nr:hemin-degrading factor [Bacteroidia bacterium]GIV22745.1 MAG: hemin-degrading factor [Bacteroidia bacterium]